jgi:uncharacterized membrane protein
MLLRKASSVLRSKATAETTQIKTKIKSQEEARTHAQVWISGTTRAVLHLFIYCFNNK